MSDDALVRGREAVRQRKWGEAYRCLTAAGQDRLAAEDLDRLARAAYLVGRVDAATGIWERAYLAFLALGETARAVRCAFWLGLTLVQRGEEARGGGWLARAQRVLDEAALDCVERGYLQAAVALQALGGGDPATAYARFGEVAAVADRFSDPDLQALARLGCGQALVAQGEAGQGVRLLDEAMVGVTTGEVSAVAAGTVYCAAIVACRMAFDLRRAQEWTAALSRWCAAQPDLKPYRGQCLVHRSEIMQLRGDWMAAMGAALQACEHLAEPPGNPVLGMALYQQGELLRLRGELAEAEEAYRQASGWGHPVQPGLALLRLAQGRLDAASAAIQRAVAEAGPVEQSHVLAAYVEIKLAAGDAGAARAAAGNLAETAGALGSPYLRAVVGYAHGSVLLADGAAAEAGIALRRASVAWRELKAPYEAARARALVGLACARLGDVDTAELEWDGAGRAFQELGAAPDLARLAALRRPATAIGGLTGREQQVLVLVAAGKTNRQIAAELVLSEHTVRRHLQNIFGKLDVTSRSAATAYAFRHGLV